MVDHPLLRIDLAMQRPLLSLLGTALLAAAHAQPPTLIRVINPSSGSTIEQITCIGTMAWMSADDGTHGKEPWTSDGTTAGTQLLLDIRPGSGNSTPGPFVQFNGTLYFGANNGVDGEQLYRSDGTAAGTQVGLDLAGIPDLNYGYYFTEYNGKLYFRGDTDANGNELWVTDGTPSGTYMLKDINPGEGNSYPGKFTLFNGLLYFSAQNSSGAELWVTDGTSAGTHMVVDICPGGCGSSPTDLAVLDGRLFFGATDGVHGTEIWKTDGTVAGTILVKDITPGESGSNAAGFTAYNGRIWFSALTDAGYRAWSTDGTEAGTVELPAPAQVPLQPSAFLAHRGLLYFKASDPDLGVQLWRSDGSPAGTYPLTIPGAAISPLYSTYNLVGCGEHLLFRAIYDEALGQQLYGIDTPMGITEEVVKAEALLTWPNPTDGTINCSVPTYLINAPVRVYDATGNVVRKDVRASGTTLQLDLSDLAAGLYVLEIGLAEQARRGVVVKR